MTSYRRKGETEGRESVGRERQTETDGEMERKGETAMNIYIKIYV